MSVMMGIIGCGLLGALLRLSMSAAVSLVLRMADLEPGLNTRCSLSAPNIVSEMDFQSTRPFHVYLYFNAMPDDDDDDEDDDDDDDED